MTALLRDSNAQAFAIGLAFAVLGPWFQVYWTQVLIWRRIAMDAGATRPEADRAHRRDLPAVVGLLERIMYFAAVLLGAEEFIAVWLALKVGAGWEGWSKGRKVPGPSGKDVELSGSHEFNTFLIGNAQSVLFAVVGAQITKWLQGGRAPEARWLGLALILLSIGLWAWAYFRARDKQSAA